MHNYADIEELYANQSCKNAAEALNCVKKDYQPEQYLYPALLRAEREVNHPDPAVQKDGAAWFELLSTTAKNNPEHMYLYTDFALLAMEQATPQVKTQIAAALGRSFYQNKNINGKVLDLLEKKLQGSSLMPSKEGLILAQNIGESLPLPKEDKAALDCAASLTFYFTEKMYRENPQSEVIAAGMEKLAQLGKTRHKNAENYAIYGFISYLATKHQQESAGVKALQTMTEGGYTVDAAKLCRTGAEITESAPQLAGSVLNLLAENIGKDGNRFKFPERTVEINGQLERIAEAAEDSAAVKQAAAIMKANSQGLNEAQYLNGSPEFLLQKSKLRGQINRVEQRLQQTSQAKPSVRASGLSYQRQP